MNELLFMNISECMTFHIDINYYTQFCKINLCLITLKNSVKIKKKISSENMDKSVP